MNKLEFVVSSILIFFIFVQGIYPAVFTECLNIPFEIEYFSLGLAAGIPEKIKFIKSLEKNLNKLYLHLPQEKQAAHLLKIRHIIKSLLLDEEAKNLEAYREIFLEDLIVEIKKKNADEALITKIKALLEKNNQSSEVIDLKEILTLVFSSLSKLKNRKIESVQFRIGSVICDHYFKTRDGNLTDALFLEKRKELATKYCSSIPTGFPEESFSAQDKLNFSLFKSELNKFKRSSKRDPFFEDKPVLGASLLEGLFSLDFLVSKKKGNRLFPRKMEEVSNLASDKIQFSPSFKRILLLLFNKK